MTLPQVLADPTLQKILAALPRARLVGGCVRDAMLDLPSADIDLATPDPPDATIAALHAAGLKSAPTGLAHGTVTAIADHRGFEITTLRRDLATDGRHATIAFTDDWRTDAARRDFTINAMSMTRDGKIHDYFDGESDLRAGRIRFVGDPATRIAEDYLRILRFFRFHARFGRGDPDPEAIAAIATHTPGLTRLSPERVWSELKRILAAPAPLPSLQLMAQTGTLEAILPEGFDLKALKTLLATPAPQDKLLRLAALLTGDTHSLAARLRLSTAEAEYLHTIRQPPPPTPSMDDAALRRLLADHPKDILLARAWLTGAGEQLAARLAAMPTPVFPLHGRDLATAGIPPGPAMGEMLAALRAWWHEGGCTADADACRAELARRLAAKLG